MLFARLIPYCIPLSDSLYDKCHARWGGCCVILGCSFKCCNPCNLFATFLATPRYHDLLAQYKQKKRTVRGLYLLRCAIFRTFCRREWDLNPRMSVLQTDALGHLAIPPLLKCEGSLPAFLPLVKHKIKFFCNFVYFVEKQLIWAIVVPHKRSPEQAR